MKVHSGAEATVLRVKKGHAGQTYKNAQQEKRGEDESRITDCAVTMVSQMKFPKVSHKEAMVHSPFSSSSWWLHIVNSKRSARCAEQQAALNDL